MMTATPWQPFVPSLALHALGDHHESSIAQKKVRNIAALFVDIVGCTRQCEDLDAQEMNEVIETFFSQYLDAVRNCDGEVTEFLGDGLLALFEGGELATSISAAIRATERIRESTALLNAQRSRLNDPIELHIGLNAGQALTGVVRLNGQSGERWFYAANGPVTNIAAHLCALARSGQALTTRAVASMMPGEYTFAPLGLQNLKNVSRPVDVVQFSLPTAKSTC